MSIYTKNYKLKKPELSDTADITQYNDSWDKVDTELKNNANNLTNHTSNKSNPHGVTKEQVGLGNVNNTADSEKTVKSAGTASKLATARKITISGDASGSATFDGSSDVTLNVTVSGVGESTGGGTIDDVEGLREELNNKAPSDHNHDSRYYNKTEIDDKLSGMPVSGHTHDDRYYTETEVDDLLKNKSDNDHTHSADSVGAVPTSRKINGKPLSSDVTLSASDVGARPATWMPSVSDMGALPVDGSASMTGDLVIEKSFPRLKLKLPSTGRELAFLATDDYVEVANKLNSTNYRGIRINPETNDVKNSVYIHEVVNGAYKDYQLFGEHNTNLLATQIQSLIEQGVIEVGEKAYTPSNNLLKTVLSSEKSTTSASDSEFFYLGKWIPEHSGAVNVTFNIKSGTSQINVMGRVATMAMLTESQDSANRGSVKLDNATVGSVVSFSNVGWTMTTEYNSSTSYVNMTVVTKVEKGVPVYFGLKSGSSNTTVYCNKIIINASEV